MLTTALFLALTGCKQPCDPGDGVAPGAGALIGGEVVCLGHRPEDLEDRLGPPAETGDLGALGTRFAWPSVGLYGLYGPGAEGLEVTSMTLREGADAKTPGGVGVGAKASAVEAELGAPAEDAFAGAWWYRADGIAFELSGDAVVAVHLFPPGS